VSYFNEHTFTRHSCKHLLVVSSKCSSINAPIEQAFSVYSPQRRVDVEFHGCCFIAINKQFLLAVLPSSKVIMFSHIRMAEYSGPLARKLGI
jgi:hypothetical protein